MIIAATQPFVPNLVFVCSAGACPCRWNCHPGVYFYPFYF